MSRGIPPCRPWIVQVGTKCRLGVLTPTRMLAILIVRQDYPHFIFEKLHAWVSRKSIEGLVPGRAVRLEEVS